MIGLSGGLLRLGCLVGYCDWVVLVGLVYGLVGMGWFALLDLKIFGLA